MSCLSLSGQFASNYFCYRIHWPQGCETYFVWSGSERLPQTQTFGKWFQARTEHPHGRWPWSPEKGQLATWAQRGGRNKCCLCPERARGKENSDSLERVCRHTALFTGSQLPRTPSQAQSPQGALHLPDVGLLVSELDACLCPWIQCFSVCRDREALKSHPEGHALYLHMLIISLSLSFPIHPLKLVDCWLTADSHCHILKGKPSGFVPGKHHWTSLDGKESPVGREGWGERERDGQIGPELIPQFLLFLQKRDKDHHWFYTTKIWELSFYPPNTPTGSGVIVILWMRAMKQESLVLCSGCPVEGQIWGHLSPWWCCLRKGRTRRPWSQRPERIFWMWHHDRLSRAHGRPASSLPQRVTPTMEREHHLRGSGGCL